MKNIIIGIDELTDSRELMTARPKPFLLWLIYIILGIAAAFVIWAAFSPLDEYVRASGIVRPSTEISSVKFPLNGLIKKVYVKDGQTVKAGDTLFEIDCESAEKQKNIETQQLENTRAQINAANKLIQSINTGTNLFNSADPVEAAYMTKYNAYQSSVNATEVQYDNNNTDSTLSQNDAKAALSSAEQSISTVSGNLQDYKTLYESVSCDESKFADSTTACAKQFDVYIKKYNTLKAQLETDKKKLSDAKSNNAAQETISALESSVANDESAVGETKQEMLSNVQNSISQLTSQLNEANLAKSKAKNAIANVTSKASGKEAALEKLKLDAISSVYDSLLTLRQNEATLNNQIYDLQTTINMSTVKAEISGKVSMLNPVRNGDLATSGNEVMSIVPQSGKNEVVLYVSESDIAHFKVNGKLKYQINALPHSEYGEATGKVISISPDVTADKTTGKSFYIVKGSLLNKSLTGYKGRVGRIKSGMACQARAVYGSKSVLAWLLEKLNFWD